MTRKRQYLAMLLQQSPDWIRGSMTQPSRYMSRMHVLLHALALRRLGAT